EAHRARPVLGAPPRAARGRLDGLRPRVQQHHLLHVRGREPQVLHQHSRAQAARGPPL
ncbi:MAG: hypothetical protein AVDCRST_MAG48-3545, partial [uncultured Friedmanniella sp.]